MSENNYGALMLKSALDTSVDVTKIIAPGIYPVITGNASAPDSSAGLMTVALTATSQKTTFQKESSSVVYSLINGKWEKPEPGDVGNFGTAAFCDVTTSTTDSTPGRVLKVGDRGFGLGALSIIEGFDFGTYPFAAGETLLISLAPAINKPSGIVSPSGWVYIQVTGVRNVYGDVSIITTDFNTVETTFCACVTTSAGGARNWVTKKLPTSATDVGALPITGGTVNGNLKVDNFSAKEINFYDVVPTGGYLINHYNPSGANRCAYGYYSGNFDVHFYNDAGTWVSNPVSIHPNGDCFFGSVYDQGHRVYSPNNPQPIDLSGYATQSWVLQNFVQNIDLTAPAEVGFRDGLGYPRGTDGAAMYNFNMVGGSSNVGNFIVRYTRKLVNNTWYVIN